ncbi:hypothetical protein A2U01_0110345, partial [Trifolium medium]|nr:hypothetical protein [Trifolium medium]
AYASWKTEPPQKHQGHASSYGDPLCQGPKKHRPDQHSHAPKHHYEHSLLVQKSSIHTVQGGLNVEITG